MIQSFLQKVTDDLISRFGIHHLDQCTLVFPMQRAGLFVKQYISQVIEQSVEDVPVVLPHSMTVDTLVDSLCPLQPNDEVTSVCQLYEIYKHHTDHTLPIDAFYGWGVQLLNDFSSVDMALLSGDDIMHYTSTIKRYDEIELDQDTRDRLETLLQNSGPQNSVREYFTALWKALPQIYREFCDTQTRLGVGSRGARSAWVINHFLDEDVQERIAGRTYVFIGFNYLLAAEWQLMNLLRDKALYYWDNDPDFHLDDNVYRFVHANIKQFPNALQDSALRIDSQPSISAIACQSSSAQSQYVNEWLLSHYNKGEKTAVVVADESMLQSVVYALPDKDTLASRVNVTKGYPLRSTQLFSQVCSILDTSVESSSADKILPETISALEAYYHHMPRPEKDSWQAVLLDESYYQIQVILRRMQLLMQRDAFVCSELSDTRVIRNLLRRQLEQVNIPFHGEPITDIQIIGVLETRLLDFDHLLILNVEEGVVPATSADRSFLPYDLRREYKMATREEDAQIYAYNFFRLFRRAKDVTLMFSDSFTDKGKRTMSRFLMQMLCSPEYDITRYRLTESAEVKPFALGSTVFTTEDKAPQHLSPSAISEYIECPRWFYLDKIRHLTESDTSGVMLPPNTIGDLLHATLKTAYLDMCGVPDGEKRELTQPTDITSDMLTAYMKDPSNLSRALDVAYQEENEQFLHYHPLETEAPYVRANHEAENHAILTMAYNVLSKDKESAPFTLVWLEHKVDITLNGISLHGIIDRLDIVNDDNGRFVRILDYKTGGFDAKKITFTLENLLTDSAKRYALQTLIYSEMTLSHIPSEYTSLPLRPQLLFTRKLSEQGYLSCGSSAIKDYQTDIQSSFVTSLGQTLQLISDNMQPGQEFIMQPDLTICANSYCPFHLLCNREKKSYS